MPISEAHCTGCFAFGAITIAPYAGYVLFTDRGRDSHAYTQLFRSGVVEAVAVFEPWVGEELGLPSSWLEKQAMDTLRNSITALASKEVEPPYYVFLSFIKVRGYRLHTSNSFSSRHDTLIDRDNLILPDVVIEHTGFDAATVMRPLFDTLWNAFGFEYCYNYDEQGNWKSR